jgi:uncharacterized protein
MPAIKLAVITGGHSFDVQPFHQLFRSLPGIDAYIQHTDEFSSEPQEMWDSYDALVFYSMFRDTPQDDGPWYTGKPKTVLEHLGETKQGIVILHHALLAYPDWSIWDEITGMAARHLRSYHSNEQIRVDVTDRQHPVAKGVNPWEMVDETYVMDETIMPDAVPGNHICLTTQHLVSMRHIGWTRQYRQARVFCFASGHGSATYGDPNFQAVLANGIRWTTGGF